MSRLGLFNIFFGFMVVGVIGLSGAVMSVYTAEMILQRPQELLTWSAILQKSAHAHGNLFGMLHVLFGLTLPYSRAKIFTKKLQTFALMLGTFAAGPLMWLRSYSSEGSFLVVLISVGLSAFLLALFSHAGFLWQRLRR